MFSPRISTPALSQICRSLSTMLGSGVPIQRAFDQAATRTGDPRARTAMRELADAVRRGEDVTSAMQAQGQRFPPMMVDLVRVAEQTGMLPEILRRLGEHYDNNIRLKKNFLMAIAWPVFQLVAAVLVIALLIWILGVIAESARGGEPIDVLGWGLTGTGGALTWLTLTFGGAFLLFVGYKMLSSSLLGQQFLDPLLLKIPVLGSCLQAFAIARFSWAFSLTQQTGMPIAEALRSSLKATGNGAFIAAIPQVCGMVKEGEYLHTALAESQLFPGEYLETVQVAETSGTVPEQLEELSPVFEDDARRKLSALVSALGWAIWCLVAAFVIFVIFSIALYIRNLYDGFLNDALR